MIHRRKKPRSIYMELAMLILAAAVAAGLFFVCASMVSETCLDEFIYDSGYVDRRNELYVDELQRFVREQGLSSDDTAELSDWVKDRKSAEVMLYKDETLIFDSYYPDMSREELKEFEPYYDIGNVYTVEFSDGEVQVGIVEKFEYQYYYIADMTELVIAFALFFAIVMFGISKRITYIRLLGYQVEIMGTGLLDMEVTVKGTDEIGKLAKQLDEMRLALKNNIEREHFLENANRKMVTEMSHDLRTPLTTMSLYLGLIKNKKYSGEKQLASYIEKMEKQIQQMQMLTEHLFDYALVSESDQIILEDPMPAKTIFYDVLSEAVSYLTEHSFRVEYEGEWKDTLIRVHSGFVSRILNNITSNICKYADPDKVVSIRVRCMENGAELEFANDKRTDIQTSGMNSTGIGIENIKSMMRKMGGYCQVQEDDTAFCIKLRF